MFFYVKLFSAILVLTIVKNSSADIQNCDYFNTVDISDIKKINDTYIYHGLQVSANRTGYYNYTKLITGPEEPVENHLRACVCELKTCVRICCPQKNMLPHGKCNNNGFKEDIGLTILNLTLNEANDVYLTDEDLKMAPLSNLTDLLVLRDPFHMCDEMVNLREDEYVMFKVCPTISQIFLHF